MVDNKIKKFFGIRKHEKLKEEQTDAPAEGTRTVGAKHTRFRVGPPKPLRSAAQVISTAPGRAWSSTPRGLSKANRAKLDAEVIPLTRNEVERREDYKHNKLLGLMNSSNMGGGAQFFREFFQTDRYVHYIDRGLTPAETFAYCLDDFKDGLSDARRADLEKVLNDYRIGPEVCSQKMKAERKLAEQQPEERSSNSDADVVSTPRSDTRSGETGTIGPKQRQPQAKTEQDRLKRVMARPDFRKGAGAILGSSRADRVYENFFKDQKNVDFMNKNRLTPSEAFVSRFDTYRASLDLDDRGDLDALIKGKEMKPLWSADKKSASRKEDFTKRRLKPEQRKHLAGLAAFRDLEINPWTEKGFHKRKHRKTL